MKLPFLQSNSKPLTVSGGFKGIGENQLSDAVNLICSDACRTRAPRKPVFSYDKQPDQIIKCDDSLFLRYGNTLKEILMEFNGSLFESTQSFNLSRLPADTDRKILLWNGKTFSFPDKIQFGADMWNPFAASKTVSVALPFIDSHTLFYTSDTTSDAFCGDSLILKVGMKLRYWHNNTTTEFTIKTIEAKTVLSEDGSTRKEVGKRMTLDKKVDDYANIPNGAKIECCDPGNRPILNDLTVGFNHNVSFSGNRIIITSVEEPYVVPLNDFFKIGQTVDISGGSIPSNELRLKITDIKDGVLYFNRSFTAVNEAPGTIITIAPYIPDFSHLIITEDRLFGIDNNEKRLYISALNNPFLFYDNVVKNEDAWSMSINELCTGITIWKDSIICFTETGGFRILGYNAKNFGIRQLPLTGIKKDCTDSLCRVGDTLYYRSDKGIMRYSGGSDNNVFLPSLPIRDVKKSSTDGVFLYVLTNDRIWVYDTVSSLCWSEDNENVLDLFNYKGEMYIALNNGLCLRDGEDISEVNWSFKLPFLPDDKYQRIMPLNLNLIHTHNTDCIINLHYKAFGNADWKSCGTHHIKGEGIVNVPLPQGYCNGFEIKADGSGAFHPQGWLVNYRRLK